MEQNPKKLNPVEPFIKTYPGQQLNNGVKPSAVDLLPEIFKTDTNKKVLSAIVEDLFQPSSLETLNFAVGNTSTAQPLPHPTARRQLEPGLLVYSDDKALTLSADELALAWGFNDRQHETPVPISILDLPIDPDKFVNWTNYYWVDVGMPVLYITGQTESFSVVDDIIGKQYFTTPVQRNGRSLELKNGMRIVFLDNGVQGNVSSTFKASGQLVDLFDYELTRNSDSSRITITVDGQPQTAGTDYFITSKEINWLTVPTAGSEINFTINDYFVTLAEDKLSCVWQVEGVGTEAGIKLLGKSHQNTNTAYSRFTDGLWDQTAVPFDQVEWDGSISGINAKHYILQKVGAKNRNAHSRVNVWYHKDTILTAAEFLGLTFSDIVKFADKAKRPIVEFDNRLELYQHGTSYRQEVSGIEKSVLEPRDYVDTPIRQAMLAFEAINDSVSDNLINLNPRILWVTKDSPHQSKIVNFTSDGEVITGFTIETPLDTEATIVNSPFASSPMEEYYWKDGVAKVAKYRTTITQQPLFELYNRDGDRLSDLNRLYGYKPNIINSNIIELVTGTTQDKESAYKLTFLPSQFSQLTDGNTARNAMYDIVFKHTQHKYSYYIDSIGNQRTVAGPLSFRRYEGKDASDELSNGYRRAWFRLKSWALRTTSVTAGDIIELDASMWPTYEWTIAVKNDRAVVLHSDDYSNVVDNRAVVSRGEVVTFNITVPNATSLIFNDSLYNIENGKVELLIPDDTPDFVTLEVAGYTFAARVIDVNQDPRFIKVKIDNLPTTYTPLISLTNDRVTSLSIQVNATGTLTIAHQGSIIENDSVTAIPGLALNPFQVVDLGEFTPSRLVDGMNDAVSASTKNGQAWTHSTQTLTSNGIQMADNSSIRAAWANLKLQPSLSEVIIARSLSAWRWHRKFIAKLEEHVSLLDLENRSAKQALDRILEELLLGVTYSSTDAVSGMAFPTNAMSSIGYIGNGSTVSYELPLTLTNDVYGPDHVYVYVNNILLKRNVDYTLDYTTSTVEFNTAPVQDAVIDVYHSTEVSVYSGIPASPAKLGLAGVFQPGFKTETWGSNSKTFIQRHDGSRLTAFTNPAGADEDYYVNKIILELENRIFNGCVNSVGEANRQRTIANYGTGTVSDALAHAQIEWYAANGLNFRDRTDFVNNDPWTWNYSGSSWRGLYLKLFGTFELHTAPWEALGYDSAPAWWNTHYSWTDSVKRQALENALVNGIISEPGTSISTVPTLARKVSSFPVDTTGMLLDPFNWGMYSPSVSEASQPWDIGSYSPIEMVWRRSNAGSWASILNCISDYTTSSKFIDSAINPFASAIGPANSTVAKGENSIAPGQFFQDRPSIGIGAAIFEAYREFNLLGEKPLYDLMAIDTRLQFGMGGFTDGAMSLQMPFTKYQSGSYVPTEDILLTKSEGVPVQALRYSAVRVEQDDVGFRVYGFDPSLRSFTIFRPTARSMTSSFPTSRRTISTPAGDFIEYLEWSTAEIAVPYGSYIANKQDLITFLMGLGEYQMSKGLIIDSLDAQGNINDWKKAALDAIGWATENWGSRHYCVVGVTSQEASLKFKHARGMLDRLDNSPGRTGKVIFHSGQSALANELLVTRDIEEHTDKIVSLLADQQIVFVDFKLREFDHIVFVNRKTKFGDLIFDPITGNRLHHLKLFGRRTYNWTGRPSVPGSIIQDYGMLPGFDTLVTDIAESHKPELSTFDPFKTKLARSNVVPASDSVVFDIIQDSTTAHLYRQGLQSAAGTNLAVNALFRNNNIDMPGRLHNVEIGEQWMFSTGEFGRLDSRRIWEIELRKSDVTNDRQIIRFNESTQKGIVDLRGDNIIDLIGKNDSRWISRPQEVNFDTINALDLDPRYSFAHDWLPSAGIANLADTAIQIMTINDLRFDSLKALTLASIVNDKILFTADLFKTKSYSRYNDYDPGQYTWNKARLYRAKTHISGSATNAFNSAAWEPVTITGRILPSIWVSDYNVQGWNVLQTLLPVFVEEACPNALQPGLNESKISFAGPHGFTVGDRFIMAGSGDGNFDNLHTVKEVVDDYNVLIEARSTSDKVVYDLVVFKVVSVKFNSDAEWQASRSKFTLLPGMKAYIDYGDVEGTWKVVLYMPDGPDAGDEYDIIEKYSGPMVDTANIYRVSVADYNNEQTIASIEIFDPYKGLTIDEVAQYIEYRQIVDPAVYNLTEIGELDRDAVDAWGSHKLGTLWWDASQVRYIEYEQSSDLQYRASHWGEKFADSTVAVYEWVFSEDIPTVEDVPTAKTDSSSGVEQIRYSEEEYVDTQTNARTTRYYYWDKRNVLPPNLARPYSAASIESVLNDPDSNGVAWLSPISENAILISNFKSFFGNNEKIILRIEQNTTPEQSHQSNVLVAEGFTGDVINDYLFNRLESSIVGRDNYRELIAIKQYTPGATYNKGDYVADFANGKIVDSPVYGVDDYPIFKNFDDTRVDVISSWQADSGKDHDIFYVTVDCVATTLDADKFSRTLIKSAIDALIENPFLNEHGVLYAIINKRRQVPSRKLHPLRRYGNEYVPEPQSWFSNIVEARRTLVTAANNFLLNIDTVSKPNWNRYLTTYRSLNGRYTRDLTKYWKYADYVAENYIVGSEEIKINSASEISSLDANITNFAIINNQQDIVEAYIKNGNNTTLVYRKNGTIQLLDNIWDGSLGDAWGNGRWDSGPWDEDASEVTGSILRALRNDIFIDDHLGYFNLLFFAMVKESINQLKVVNWVTKTTYLEVTQESIRDFSFTKTSQFYNRRENNIQEYINEVKPFHSKIVDTKQFSKTSIEVGVAINESIALTITTLPLLITENEELLTTESSKAITTGEEIVTVQELTET